MKRQKVTRRLMLMLATLESFKQSTKMSTARITGYQVQIAANRAFTKGKKTVTVKGYKHTAKTIKQLKAKKTYLCSRENLHENQHWHFLFQVEQDKEDNHALGF